MPEGAGDWRVGAERLKWGTVLRQELKLRGSKTAMVVYVALQRDEMRYGAVRGDMGRGDGGVSVRRCT